MTAVREHDLVCAFGVQFHRCFIVEFEDNLRAGAPHVLDLHVDQDLVIKIEIFLVLALGVFRDEHEPVLDRIQAALHALFHPEIARDPLKGKELDEIHVLQEVGVPDRNRGPVFVDFPHPWSPRYCESVPCL